MKKCSKCKIEKSLAEFGKCKSFKDGLQYSCKDCNKEYRLKNKTRISNYKINYKIEKKENLAKSNKKYYENNKNEIIKYQLNYANKNRKKVIGYKNKWREKNKDYQKNRSKVDFLYRLRCVLGKRTRDAFKNNGYKKKSKTRDILGIDFETVKKHIEINFTEGMSWNNYGEWHIDHIIPLSSAKNEDELIGLCHYTNLQPLWAKDNLVKSNKINGQQTKMRI